jgi:hypothetical protein
MMRWPSSKQVHMHLISWRVLFIAAIALAAVVRTDTTHAQIIPKSLQESGSDAAIKQRKNAWTVGIAGGLIDGTYMRFADELGKVLDDGDNLRILLMVSYGAASNLDDLLYLRGVDIVSPNAFSLYGTSFWLRLGTLSGAKSIWEPPFRVGLDTLSQSQSRCSNVFAALRPRPQIWAAIFKRS